MGVRRVPLLGVRVLLVRTPKKGGGGGGRGQKGILSYQEALRLAGLDMSNAATRRRRLLAGLRGLRRLERHGHGLAMAWLWLG